MQPRQTKKDFRFHVSRLCLTLPATLGDRGKTPYERLNTPEDLSRWLRESGFLDFDLSLTDNDLIMAKNVREAIQRAGEALATGKTINRTDLEEINLKAMVEPPIPQLSKDGNKVIWKKADLQTVLSMLCRDFINLAASPHSANMKICENLECIGLYIDESRPKNRRWCSMQTCGNKMKKSKMGKGSKS